MRECMVKYRKEEKGRRGRNEKGEEFGDERKRKQKRQRKEKETEEVKKGEQDIAQKFRHLTTFPATKKTRAAMRDNNKKHNTTNTDHIYKNTLTFNN